MWTREELQYRRDELSQHLSTITEELEQLERLRAESAAQYHTLSGMVSMIDELLQKLGTSSSEP